MIKEYFIGGIPSTRDISNGLGRQEAEITCEVLWAHDKVEDELNIAIPLLKGIIASTEEAHLLKLVLEKLECAKVISESVSWESK